MSNLRLYCRAIVTKSLVLHKNRQTDQNRIGDLEINWQSYGHLGSDKGGKNEHWKKDSLFSWGKLGIYL